MLREGGSLENLLSSFTKVGMMDRFAYARFLSRQGLRITEVGGELWAEKRRLFFENIPPHRRVHLTRWGATELFLRGAAAVRYTCHKPEGKLSYEYICDDKNYDLTSLNKTGRNLTRRGLENCVVRQIDFELLAELGCDINRSVLARQKRTGSAVLVDQTRWKQYMHACRQLPDVVAYGAFIKDRLCAFSMAAVVDNYAYFYHVHSNTDDLRLGPMKALIFTATRELIRRPEVNVVSYGLEPFAPMPSLEGFKLSMGFRKRGIERRVLVNPLARPFFGESAQKVAQWLPFREKFGGALQDFLTFSRSLQEQSSLADHTLP